MRVWTALVALLALGAMTAVAYADHPAGSKDAVAAVKAPPARSLAAATGTDRRYALANGCYALRSRANGRYVTKDVLGYRAKAGSVGAAEPFRMQATTLGRYLFYGRNRDFMGAASGNSVRPAGSPSPNADWKVDVSGNAFKISLPATGEVLGLSGDRLVTAGSAPRSSPSRRPRAAPPTRRSTRARRARRCAARRPGARSGA